MKKLLIMVPVWKRPEILKLFVSRLNLPTYLDTKVLFLISPEDPFFKANLKLINGFEKFIVENETLGRKKNLGLLHAMQLNWDYFIEFGSDDIYLPELWRIYEPLFNQYEYFGIRNAACYDTKTGRAVFTASYNEGNAIGPGRVIHRNIINELGKLWRDDWAIGMDGCSHFKIEQAGYSQYVYDNEEPLILDIKTATNLNSFFEIDGIELDSEYIMNRFSLDKNSIDPIYFTTIELTEFHNRVEKATQNIGSKKLAFEQVNTEYAAAFGKPKYKNYESYRVHISTDLKRN